MNKSLFTLATLSAFAAGAYAQSSVTLFGVVDAAVRQVKNGSAGSMKQLASGSNATSRWGLRGVEDLGGGLRAGFHLESGIGVDAGTTDAKFWGRRSTVSLIGGFGEIRLGRDYAPTEWNTYFEPFGAVGVGSSGIFTYGAGASLGSPVGTAPASTLRKDNSIGYFLPAMGGVYGQAMVSAGEGIDGNKYIGGRIGYAAGPIDVAVAVGNTDLVSGTDFKQSNVMFNYNFGFAKLHTFYDVKKWSPRQQKVLSVGATVPMGAGVFKLALANADRSGGAVGSGFGDADDSRLMAVGYEHNLSKRSALYTTYSRVTNKGAARSSVVYSAPAGMLGGETSTGLELGVRHRF